MAEPAAANPATAASEAPVRRGAPPSGFSVADPALQARFGCPAEAFLDRLRAAQPAPPSALGTGAVVFNAARAAVLLVQRSAADSMPGLWETPGGGVDRGDDSVLHAVARELWEEAGLRAARVRCAVPCRAPRGADDDGLAQVFRSRSGRLIAKYSFVVDVEDDAAVQLDPNEHQAFVWATEEECVRGAKGDTLLPFTTNDQREIILEAWRIVKGEI